MKTCVVIPTKNGGEALARCLDGIYHQACDLDLEVIVVDSGSRDNTLEVARSYGATIRTIPPSSFTHGGARNLGASLSEGQYVVFCNQDVVPANRDWLRNLLAAIDKKGVGAAYSRQIAPSGTPLYERVSLDHLYPTSSRLNTHKMLKGRGPSDVVLFSTVSGGMTKSIWERFRFREDIVMAEDQEFACRALMSGYAIAYAADSVVYHSNHYSLSGAFRRYFDSGWSMTYLPFLRVSNIGKSLTYLSAQAKEILRDANSEPSDRLSALGYLAAKVFGFALGQLAPYLSHGLRSRISYTRSLVDKH